MHRVFKSFAELAAALAADADDQVPAAADEEAEAPDVAALVREIEEAEAALDAAATADEEESERARRLLEAHDALRARRAEAAAGAAALALRAEELREGAFGDAARDGATRIHARATRAQSAAARAAELLRSELERAERRPDVCRALALRREEEASRAAEFARSARRSRIEETLHAVRAAIADRDPLPAKRGIRELDDLLSDAEGLPFDPAYQDVVRELRVAAAAVVLDWARKLYLLDPISAVATMDRAELRDLPDPLRRDLVGVWVRACAGACRARGLADARLVRLPPPRHGAVVARREPAGPHMVVGVLGVDSPYPAGMTVPDWFARGAPPLRAAQDIGPRAGKAHSREKCHAH